MAALSGDLLSAIDDEYRELLAASEKATLRTRHLAQLKRIKSGLARIQSDHVLSLSTTRKDQRETSDTAPHFAPLVTDTKMQMILGNRWKECVNCVENGAPLAAAVMMGGMLEGLLLARVNQLQDKSRVFTAASSPKDRAGTPLPLKEWGLSNFLDVAHELQWISKATKDVGSVVREYRNYIHPQKEYSGMSISSEDAKMLWGIAKSVARQVLKP